jgi:hypothetical protein
MVITIFQQTMTPATSGVDAEPSGHQASGALAPHHRVTLSEHTWINEDAADLTTADWNDNLYSA